MKAHGGKSNNMNDDIHEQTDSGRQQCLQQTGVLTDMRSANYGFFRYWNYEHIYSSMLHWDPTGREYVACVASGAAPYPIESAIKHRLFIRIGSKGQTAGKVSQR